jgi:arabinofuranosyltransferase
MLTLVIGAGAGAVALRTRQYAMAAIGGGALVFWLHGIRYARYTSDDSYISYRYARNLSDGLGLVWNRGDHVEGYTNFLWVVVLAAFHKAGADIVFTGRWLGFALGIVAIAGTYALTRTLAGGNAGKIAGVGAALLLAASGPFAVWGTAGLETSLFAALLLAATLLHLREQDRDQLPLSGALWALLMMTHPSGVVPFAVSAAFKAGEAWWRVSQSATETRDSVLAREARSLGMWIAAFALIYVPYFAWRYVTYDWIFPNTYYVKVGSGIEQYSRGVKYTARFAMEYGVWILLAAPAAIALGTLRRLRAAYVLAIVVAVLAYVIYVGGDNLLRYRFFAPMLPLLYAVSLAGAASIARAIRLPDVPGWAAAAAGAAAFAALVLFTLEPTPRDLAIRFERETVRERVAMGQWLRENVPSDTVIAVVPAGSIPYESRLTTIDMLGLNDEHIAHNGLVSPDRIAGHEKYDSAYVLRREPDIIVINDHFSKTPWRLSDYRVLEAQLITAIPDMLKSPGLLQDYSPRSVEVRPGNWFNLFVRDDATAIIAVTQAAPQDPALIGATRSGR